MDEEDSISNVDLEVVEEETEDGHEEKKEEKEVDQEEVEAVKDDLEEIKGQAYRVSSSGEFVNEIDEEVVDSEDLMPDSEVEDSAYDSSSDESDDDEERFKNVVIVQEHPLNDDDIRKGLEKPGKTPGGFYTHTHLNLTSFGLIDISTMGKLRHLKTVDVSRNYLKDVRAFGSLNYLERVDASRNEIEDFLDFKPPIALKEVNFSRNRISAITVDLKNFWALTEINLSHNQIKKVVGFRECRHLRLLDLSHNQIAEITHLECPNLIVLLLNRNAITSLNGIESCDNLRYLNISRNQISDLSPLKSLFNLIELKMRHNNLFDILELDHLKLLLHLRCLSIHKNPLSELGMFRLLLIDSLPQLIEIDDKDITANEKLEARDTFTPRFTKQAFVDHTKMMLERATQSATLMLNEHALIYPIPPIILLVGAQHSELDKMAFLLKKHFYNKIQLGGVYSTATKMEGEKDTVDIPISYEHFQDMRKRGEFLTTSHVLGRVCGFATSQIAKAVEKKAILVATIPLVSAICLKKWLLRPVTILVSPSQPPHLLDDEKRKSFSEGSGFIDGELEDEEGDHEHLVHFNQNQDQKLLPQEKNLRPRHSILKKPSFELGFDENGRFGPLRKYFKNEKPVDLDKKSDEVDVGKPEEVNTASDGQSYERQMQNLEEISIDGNIELTKKKVSTVSSYLLKKVDKLEDKGSDFIEEILLSLPDKFKVQQKGGETNFIQKKQLGLLPIDSSTRFGISEKRKGPKPPQEKPSDDLTSSKSQEIPSKSSLTKFLEISDEISPLKSKEPENGQGQEALKPEKEVNPSNLANLDEETPSSRGLKVLRNVIDQSGAYQTLSPSEFQLKTIPKNANLDNTLAESTFNGSEYTEQELKTLEPFVKALSGGQEGVKGNFQAFFGDLGEQESAESIKQRIKVSHSKSKAFQKEEDQSHRFRNRDAMVNSVMETRQSYEKFHQRNPGFFVAVVDPSRKVEAEESLLEIVNKLLETYEVSQPFGATYGGEEEEEAEIFKGEKLRKLKEASLDWSKGYESGFQHLTKGTCEVRSAVPECDKIFFEKKSIPKNLLEPNLVRPHFLRRNQRPSFISHTIFASD